MKKIFFVLSAFALFGLASCVDQINKADINPTFDPETNTVTTQFVFSVMTGTKTKMTGTAVQAGGENFRGMKNAAILVYAPGTDGDKPFVAQANATADAAKRFDFPNLLASGAVDNDGSKSNRILEIGLPVGSNAVLFYGIADRGPTDDDENFGKVTYGIGDKDVLKANQITFSLNPRVPNSELAHFQRTQNLLALILTRIAGAVSSGGDATLWSTLGANYDKNRNVDPADDVYQTPLEENLGKLYSEFTTIKGTEYRAGSGAAVLQMAKDIYAVALPASQATATSTEEGYAKSVASDIVNRLQRYFTITSGEISDFKAISDIRAWVRGTPEGLGLDWTDYDMGDDNYELENFPIDTYKLPAGAAILSFDTSNKKFVYNSNANLLTQGNATSAQLYQYPAELIYRGNSSIRTSDSEKKVADYPNGVGNWQGWTIPAGASSTDWNADGSAVTSSSRAAAMTQNINYGVALLETQIRANLSSGQTAFNDNRNAFTGEGDAAITPNLTLKGVLVGNQPEAVDWQFLPTDATFAKTVYDNKVGTGSGIAVPVDAAYSGSNYTILFDNFNRTAMTGSESDSNLQAGQTSQVRVALEFVNNGDGFWGRDNYIRRGGTFYLVGVLDMTNATAIADGQWDTYYQLPPLTAAGKTRKITRVFIQDFMTTAKFTIDGNSLKSAYVTVPDLRSSQLSFGLSVDIDWRTGLVFDDVVLGSN